MRTEQLSILALGFCGITAIVGCGEQSGGTNAPASESQESSGEVNLALQLANGSTIIDIEYAEAMDTHYVFPSGDTVMEDGREPRA